MKHVAVSAAFTIAVAVLGAGQQEKSDLRATIERELDACKPNHRVFFQMAKDRSAEFFRELTAILDETPDMHRRRVAIVAFRELGRQKLLSDTPSRIIEEALRGDPETRTFAVGAAAHIGDRKAVDLIVKLLQTPAEPKGPGNLLYTTEISARHTGSAEVAAALLPLAKRGSVAALESLAHIGIGFTSADLQDVKGGQQGYVRMALDSAAILSAPDRQVQLLEAVRKPPSPGGWLSRPEWALDKIERNRLTGCIEPLRKLYAEFEKCPHALPENDHYRRYWRLFRVRMLRTIQRLGGELSAEESQLIQDNPYLD